MGTAINAIILCLFFGSAIAAVDFDLNDVMAIAQMIGLSESSALKESSQAFHDENALLYKIQGDNKDYDKKRPPAGKNGAPLELSTTFIVDHVEALDENQETMTVHGSVTLKWTDTVFTWDPDQYHQIHAISRSLNDYGASLRPWTPVVTFRTADPADNRRAESANDFATILTLSYNGDIALHKKFTVKAPCNFDYRDFPYDSQKCSIILTSQHSFREVWFSYDVDQSKHQIRQLKKEGGSPMIGDFVLDFVHVFNAFTNNDQNLEQLKGPWKSGDRYSDAFKLSAIVTIAFNRANDKYFYSFSIPLVATAVMAQAAMFFDTKKGFLMLTIPLILLTSQMGMISQRFPSDADGTPLLVMMHYLAIAHVFVCFVGLVILAHFYAPRVGLTKDRKPAPSHYYLTETQARLIYFLTTSLFVFMIAVGTLYYGAWRHWVDEE